MARANVLLKDSMDEGLVTHGGAKALRVGTLAALRRSVLSTLLWEKQFYEDGVSIRDRIHALALECDPASVARLAVEARKVHGLRHAPLALIVALTRTARGMPGIVEDTVFEVVSRADEAGELLALYWMDGGRRPIANALKRGLARAMAKFDAYQIAKYDRAEVEITFRDAMFLARPKPSGQNQEMAFRLAAERNLPAPDSWEVAVMRGEPKAAALTRLLREERLGYMALLRNLRALQDGGEAERLVIDRLRGRKGANGVLPSQFLSAAEQAPRYARVVEEAMMANVKALPRLAGKTVIVGDASGSMNNAMSYGSARTRLEATGVLMGMLVAMCEDPVVYATAGSDGRRVHDTKRVRAAEGLGMVDVMRGALRKQGGGGIFLTQCMAHVRQLEGKADRVIVLTDEQDCDTGGKGAPAKADAFGTRNYLINVASAKNGIGYRKWTHVDGFSEAVLKWIPAFEADEDGEA